MAIYQNEELRKALEAICENPDKVLSLTTVTFNQRSLWRGRALTIFSQLDPAIRGDLLLRSYYAKGHGLVLQVSPLDE